MMARRLAGILPPLDFDEALESTAIHSVAGLLPAGGALLNTRPFRAPHHTISHVALVGGGSQPRPGEISLAHNGVLLLDEIPEFDRACPQSPSPTDRRESCAGRANGRHGGLSRALRPRGRYESLSLWLPGRCRARLPLYPATGRALSRATVRAVAGSTRSRHRCTRRARHNAHGSCRCGKFG